MLAIFSPHPVIVLLILVAVVWILWKVSDHNKRTSELASRLERIERELERIAEQARLKKQRERAIELREIVRQCSKDCQ